MCPLPLGDQRRRLRNLRRRFGGRCTFGDVSVANGIGDGISITNNTGALTFGGQTTITNPGVVGVDIEGTNGTINFTNLDIALQTANTTGFDLSGATVNANITATDFDLTSASATGTVGVNLVGTTGTATVQLGDSSLPFNAGQGATIAAWGQSRRAGNRRTAFERHECRFHLRRRRGGIGCWFVDHGRDAGQ